MTERSANAIAADGANWLKAVSPIPASAWCEALSIAICSRTAASRSIGSSMATGRSANIAVTWLS